MPQPSRDLFLVPNFTALRRSALRRSLGARLSAKLSFPHKPEACQHRSWWLSAQQGATPPVDKSKLPDPGGITAHYRHPEVDGYRSPREGNQNHRRLVARYRLRTKDPPR